MNLIWRMIWTLLFSRFGTKVNLFAKSTTRFTVLPTDIDVLMHMNNGRYFSFMDLARTNHMIRTGKYFEFSKHHLYPVVASEMIRFRKSVNIFQRFDITTELVYWDERFFYIAHEVICNKQICAKSLIKACFLKKPTTRVTTREVLTLVDELKTSPAIPSWISDWQSSEKDFLNS